MILAPADIQTAVFVVVAAVVAGALLAEIVRHWNL